MNERLITDLLAAYGACPPEKLRLHRQVTIDAMEEAGDRRVEKLRRWKITEVEYPIRMGRRAKGKQKTVKRYEVSTEKGARLKSCLSVDQAEVAIRNYSRAVFLEMWPDDEFKRKVVAERSRYDEWLVEMHRQGMKLLPGASPHAHRIFSALSSV